MAGTNTTSIKSYIIYQEGSTDNSNTFANKEIDFGFTSQGIRLINDNASNGATIQISFDGTNVHGTIKGTETLPLDFLRMQKIFLRSASTSAFRLWIW